MVMNPFSIRMTSSNCSIADTLKLQTYGGIFMVPPARIELAAHGLGIHCSIH